jgi:protein-histidine pros-kinase
MNLRRFDTLPTRLFLLMWMTLLVSHLLAISVVRLVGGPGHMGLPGPGPHRPQMPPPLAALAPGTPLDAIVAPAASHPPGLSPAEPNAGTSLPTAIWWLDFGVRALVVVLGAALGARWLSAPIRRMSRAAKTLSADLAQGQSPTPLDERRSSYEAQALAKAFNAMTQRLQEQFDGRSMQMAALSHDLRTPLTRLRMRLQDAPTELRESATGDILEMSDMVDATLAVLREQRDGVMPAPLDLRSLLEAIVDDHLAAGRQVSLMPGKAPRARAHPAALRRVIDNLVGNALRYGGSAQLALYDGDDRIVLTVEDTGPGIPESQLEQAFKPWVRLEAGHGPRAGHGLGLCIARDLAERNGGTLHLSNRPEGGLRATLTLPALRAANAQTGP